MEERTKSHSNWHKTIICNGIKTDIFLHSEVDMPKEMLLIAKILCNVKMPVPVWVGFTVHQHSIGYTVPRTHLKT